MTFFWVIGIVVLAGMLPIFFVLKDKRQKKSQSHFQPLYHTQQHWISDDPMMTDVSSSNEIQVDFEDLPIAFQQIIQDIEAQFLLLQEKMSNSNAFKSQWQQCRRIFYVRLPEVVTEYQKLDKSYANHVVVDSNKGWTSYDLTLMQIRSILGFLHQMAQQMNQNQVSGILINQRYLKSVYAEAGIEASFLNANAKRDMQQILWHHHQTGQQMEWELGRQYLWDYWLSMSESMEQHLQTETLVALGELVYLASIAQLSVSQYLEDEFYKMNIHSEYGIEALELLLTEKIPSHLDKLLPNFSLKQQVNLQYQIGDIHKVLLNMVKVLDKDIGIDIKFSQLQQLDNRLWDFIHKQWF